MTASAVHLLKRLLEVALPDGLLCFSRIFARLLRLADHPLYRLPEQPAGNAHRQQNSDQYCNNNSAGMFALSHKTNVPATLTSVIHGLASWPGPHSGSSVCYWRCVVVVMRVSFD